MAKIKYPTTYLKDRRTNLGLTQLEVAEAIGVEKWALQKLEQRGEMPEIHFDKLARVLKVPVMDLYVEKYAPVMRTVFHIPTENFRKYVRENIGTDRAFGHKAVSLTKNQMVPETHNPGEDNLPELHKKVLHRVRTMTAKEGFQELIKSGIYTPDGQLAPEYGGPGGK